MSQTSQDTRSIGELFSDLTREIGTLVRDEVNLAKSELTEKATQAGKQAGAIAIGGVLAFAGLLALQYAAIVALAGAMPLWAAALIVGVIVMGIGGALAFKGINALKHQDLTPHETINTLKEDARWAKQQVK
jgi:hypothetical protein